MGRQKLTIAKGFGERVYNLMQEQRTPEGHAWKTKDLAEAAKASQSSIVRWIGGKIPQPDKLKQLAKALNTTIEFLIDGIGPRRADISGISGPGRPNSGGEGNHTITGEKGLESILARREAAGEYGVWEGQGLSAERVYRRYLEYMDRGTVIPREIEEVIDQLLYVARRAQRSLQEVQRVRDAAGNEAPPEPPADE